MADIKSVVEECLQLADIQIGGSNPWDIHVHDPRFYQRIIDQGSLGLGESYIEGWWDSPHLDDTFYHLLCAQLNHLAQDKRKLFWASLKAAIFNFQSKSRAFIVGEKHYDLGNDLFQAMLDKRMTYSCAYWKDAQNLEEAQEAKLELICKKLYLKPGMKLLDIGCGWGSFTNYVAERYGVNVVGITVSKNQFALAQQLSQGKAIEYRLQDYREVVGSFDRIVSIGQMEHVGYKNYPVFMQKVRECLNEDGLFLLHTIGQNRSFKTGDPWINKYIFPNGMIPSPKQIAVAAENVLVIEDWQNIGVHYDKTLMAWHHNFNNHWESLSNTYDKQFYRMWTYFLLSCAGAFRARSLHVWHIVFSKKGILKGYQTKV